MRMVSCLAFTAQIHWSLFCFLVLVLSTGLLWWSVLAYTVPLKLGLMRASYPDVFPMSLSRKSEGDSCGPALPGGFISSLQELSLTLPREGKRGGTNTKRKKKKVDLRNSRGVCMYERQQWWQLRKKKKRDFNRMRSQQISPSQSSAKHTQRWMGKWGWKMTVLPQLATKSLSISHHVWDLLWLLGPNHREAKQTQR